MDEKTELVSGLVAGSDSPAKANAWDSWRRAVRACLGILPGSIAGVAAVAVVTFCAFRLHLNLSTSVSLHFLIVVMVSAIWGFWEATVTSLVAYGCLDYFFTLPLFSLTVSDPQDWVALGTFEIAVLVVSRLSTRVQGQARAEARQRAQVEKLYELSRRILFLDRSQTIGPQIVSLIQEIFKTESVALFDATAVRLDATGPRAGDLEQLARRAYFQNTSLEGPGGHTWAQVLRLGSSPEGAIALSGPELSRFAVEPIASLAAIAIERARSFEKEGRAEAARQTEQLRTTVLDALAHAFKTPLTAIRTASSGMLEAGRLTTDDTELAALIDDQAEHMNRLATELLQMAKIDAAEVRLRRERVPVLTLIEDVVARHREQLRGRSVRVADSAAPLEVQGDREMLAAALEQFIDNAARYSTPGSPISVTAEENLGEVVIAVHNEGPPIRPADRERIFERFYRAEESRHRASGTGLGLSIAKKAAEAHGGRTWVVSEERTGTTFFFALPGSLGRRYESVAG